MALFLFLNDIVVSSSSIEQHFEWLEMVLGRVQKDGLKAKFEKCAFFQPQVSYLGHVFSAQGVSSDPKNLKAMVDWRCPTHISELCSDLGLVGYDQHFVKGFAKLEAPLHRLVVDLVGTRMRKRSSQTLSAAWTPQCEESLEDLKAPARFLPSADFSQPFI